jgi:branched-chain amino acid transport system substrate-binding protein
MGKYNPAANERDASNVYGCLIAGTVVEVLKKCGDELSRAHMMKQATNLDLEPGKLRPGIGITTSPTDRSDN